MGAVNNKTRSKKSRPKTSDLNLFDWLAPNYENLQGAIDPSRFQFHSIMLDILNALELEPETVLDLGCGTGTLAGQILELFEDSHVYLIDNSLQMLEIA
ncbi:MAG TPA: methyltransferase domain-containing protein, partial [bacterium]